MFALDIETVPLAASLEATYPREEFAPPANYKNPDAIEKWYVSDEARWRDGRVKACSLNPRLGRIVALGMSDAREDVVLLAQEPADEPQLLRDFWSAAHRAVMRAMQDGTPHVVTWNGGFDLRFLLIRSLAHGITPSRNCAIAMRAWFKRYDLRAHFDVKAALLNHDVRATGEGLDEWAAFFGLERKPMQASDVYAAVRDGRWDDLRAYVRHDARTTWALYERIAPMFSQEPL